jgi:hypothetical protein
MAICRYKPILMRSIILLFCLLSLGTAFAQQTPLSGGHLDQINTLFKQNNVPMGYVVFDRFGRVELKGEYNDEREVDKAFSLAQTVVGVRWVSPVTPENIRVKEWEKRLGSLFSRARVLEPSAGGDTSPGPVRNRFALIVGVGQFKYGINSLQFSVRDAASFYQFLTEPNRGSFPKQNVTFLTDHNATRDNIARALDNIRSNAGVDDMVVIYMSSHGSPPDKRGAVNIVTYDTEVKPRERIWHTSINEEMLKDFVNGLRSKRLIMILDTCYSNGAYRQVPGFLPPGGKSIGTDEEEGYGISKEYGKRLLGAKDIVLEDKPKSKASAKNIHMDDGWGKVMIGASSGGERSWESDALKNSIFTYYFVDGLQRNNGSVQNAFYYSQPKVSQRVKQEKGSDIDQHPQIMTTTQNWDMKLSKR